MSTIEIEFRGPLADALRDDARYLDVEGAFRSGKSWWGCYNILRGAVKYPGMASLVCRTTDTATHTILRPTLAKVAQRVGIPIQWQGEQSFWRLDNGSQVYVMGLKSSEEATRYAKFRGLTLARIFWDQPEEGKKDYFEELQGRLSQPGYPQQFILTPNPEFSEDHWLARFFPYSNVNPGYRVYTVSIYDNAQNLDVETIRALESAYPAGHPKRRPALLGLRGVKVLGDPVYGAYFDLAHHVAPIDMNPMLSLLEAWDFGRRNPAVLWAQYTPFNGLHWLGGVMGLSMALEDFKPAVCQLRRRWFPRPLEVQHCCDPAGSHANSQGLRNNGVAVLKDEQIGGEAIPVRYIENSNAPDVRRGVIERIQGYMRRRTPMGEAFQVHPDRWVLLSNKGETPSQVVLEALQAGYVWDMDHPRNVGNKQIVVPVKDGWFEHLMNCAEYMELNFGGAQPTEAQAARRAARIEAQAMRVMQKDRDPEDARVRLAGTRRGHRLGGGGRLARRGGY